MAPRRTTRRLIGSALVAGFGMASLIVGLPSTAKAATAGGSTTANVVVGSAISLTGLTPSFTITGNPGDTANGVPPVTMVVTTNNFAGYSVTVQAAAAILAPTIAGNTDSIPIARLLVSGDATGGFVPSTNVAPGVLVHTQANASAEAGDTITNLYRMIIPFVREDTYHATLNYLATTL